MEYQNFNSQPHKEADRFYSFLFCRVLISTHSLTRRLTPADHIPRDSAGYFNSQPHKEADEDRSWKIDGTSYFNSQPHKEADIASTVGSKVQEAISTHSLTRRLTAEAARRAGYSENFNSQPHKEADIC